MSPRLSLGLHGVGMAKSKINWHQVFDSDYIKNMTPHVRNLLVQTLPLFCVDTVEGVCNGFLPYTRFLGFLEFSGYHQWQQESQ